MRLKDKIIIITGAGSGIGRETSLHFTREGATVVILDINDEGGNRTVEEIKEEGNNAAYIRCDATNAIEVKRAVDEIIATYGRIDVLFNNVGVSGVGKLHELEEELWDKVMEINVKGVFLPSKYVLPHMMDQKSGSIINMSSSVAEMGLLRRSVYAASKGAVLSLTKSMQVDYAEYNIRINAILPGTILTPFVEDYLANAYDDREEALEGIKKRQLSDNIGYPEDVAKAALFLASDESQLVMGSPLYVDGGLAFGKKA